MDWTRLPLARAALDRAAHRRAEPDLLARVWREPGTAVLLVRGSDLATAADGCRLDLLEPAAVADGPDQAGLVLYLGEDESGAVLAVVVGAEQTGPGQTGAEQAGAEQAGAEQAGAEQRPAEPTAPAAPGDGRTWTSLRACAHLLPDRDAGLATTAVGLAAWHERHPRCARCGEPTRPALAGWTRRCEADGSEHYPRTDPAVIMAVTDAADRLLLAHGALWPARRMSTLAGYVEPGESAEHAVVREVREEVGVDVVDPVFRGSQPWPFPASLMLAFTARALGATDLKVDGEEVTEARWFTREQLADAVASGEVVVPTRASVARALIEDWFGGPLEGGAWEATPAPR